MTFSENVGAKLTLADFTLTNRANGKDVSDLLTSLALDPDTDIATITFAPLLPDGDYRLTLPAGAAFDAAGNASSVPLTFDFFQFSGDVNRDRAVDFNDLVVLAQNYNAKGRSPRYRRPDR